MKKLTVVRATTNKNLKTKTIRSYLYSRKEHLKFLTIIAQYANEIIPKASSNNNYLHLSGMRVANAILMMCLDDKEAQGITYQV